TRLVPASTKYRFWRPSDVSPGGGVQTPKRVSCLVCRLGINRKLPLVSCCVPLTENPPVKPRQVTRMLPSALVSSTLMSAALAAPHKRKHRRIQNMPTCRARRRSRLPQRAPADSRACRGILLFNDVRPTIGYLRAILPVRVPNNYETFSR